MKDKVNVHSQCVCSADPSAGTRFRKKYQKENFPSSLTPFKISILRYCSFRSSTSKWREATVSGYCASPIMYRSQRIWCEWLSFRNWFSVQIIFLFLTGTLGGLFTFLLFLRHQSLVGGSSRVKFGAAGKSCEWKRTSRCCMIFTILFFSDILSETTKKHKKPVSWCHVRRHNSNRLHEQHPPARSILYRTLRRNCRGIDWNDAKGCHAEMISSTKLRFQINQTAEWIVEHRNYGVIPMDDTSVGDRVVDF